MEPNQGAESAVPPVPSTPAAAAGGDPPAGTSGEDSGTVSDLVEATSSPGPDGATSRLPSDVPDTLEGIGPNPRWAPTAYQPGVFASGADKLSDSAVAPLVAAARGYRTITADTVKSACLDYGLPGLVWKSSTTTSAPRPPA